MFSLGAICCLSVFVFLQAGGSNGSPGRDYFTSVAGLEALLGTEAYLLSNLKAYVQSVNSHLEMLKNEMVEIEKEHTTAAFDLEEYLSSPINAFLLIKRLDKDWKNFENSVENDIARKSFLSAISYSREYLPYPTDEDTTGSAVGLVRLQETYQLDVSQIAAGILNGVKYGSPMSWQDCFQMGEQLYVLKDFNHTIPWLQESFEKLQREKYFNSSETIGFLEIVVHYHAQMGNFKTALEVNSKVLELEPDREYSLDYKKYLEIMVEQGHGLVEPVLEKFDAPEALRKTTKAYKTYEKVCRGEIKQSPSEERDLRCRNHHRNVPYRLLMPFKMEELNLDPYVAYFHDVISDDEIEAIKEMSKPRMARSQVRSFDDPASRGPLLYRTSQNTWLKYEALPAAENVKRRVGDITGLDMNGSEELQVANYGIGGQYEPHYDFFEADSDFNEQDGNRVATAIFYLSNVELGGATGFPYLKRAVQPQKGNLMIWYNLHKDGERDFRTKHAACPVLKGSKWVANVWVRNRRQTLIRPCDMQPDSEVSAPYEFDE